MKKSKFVSLLFIPLLLASSELALATNAKLVDGATQGETFVEIILKIVSVCVLILGIFLAGQFALSLRGGQGGQGSSKLGTLGGAIAAIAFGGGLLFSTIQADFLGGDGATNSVKKVQLGYFEASPQVIVGEVDFSQIQTNS